MLMMLPLRLAGTARLQNTCEQSQLPRRFTSASNFSSGRWLGNLSASYVDDAYFQDVLDARFAGPTEAYTQVNGAIGVKFAGDRITATMKVINLLDEDIQSHVFGDFLKRQVIGELRFQF